MYQYRADIDGLRAVAVLSVVFFHADISAFSGGYTGVDVFFVISGFLITQLLLKEADSGTYSLINFYARRAKRLFPALVVVMLFVLGMSWFVSYPKEMEFLGQQMVSVSLFLSNFLYYIKLDYFGATAESTALLHTWSLAVEEQFYLLYPLFLVFLFNRSQRILLICTCLLACASLIASVIMVRSDASAAFYLPQYRFFELFAGGLVAILCKSDTLTKVQSEIVGALGLCLIAVSIFLFDKSTAFPGEAALVPVIGSVCIICSGIGNQTFVSRMLGLKPVVFIGLISYSLYLWHWPILVFARQIVGVEVLQLMPALFLVAVSLIVSWLSWRFVEKPFRYQWQSPVFNVRTCAVALGTFGVVGVVGLALSASGGVPTRFGLTQQDLASNKAMAASARESYREGDCFLRSSATMSEFNRPDCLNDKGVLLVGDSFAAHLYPGLIELLGKDSVSQVTSGGCRILLGKPREDSKNCRDVQRWWFNGLLSEREWSAVIVASRWSESDVPVLRDTLVQLKKSEIPILLSGPVAQYKADLPLLLKLGKSETSLSDSAFSMDRILAQLALDHGIDYISNIEIMCKGTPAVCIHSAPSGDIMQWDYGHLTAEGSKWLLSNWPMFGFDNDFLTSSAKLDDKHNQ